MTARTTNLLSLLTALALVAPGFLQGQQANQRYRVLVPDFEPREGADDDFGEDAAEELRELLGSLATHQAVEKDELEDNLDRFNLEMDDLNCLRTRQLASQMNVQVVLCASYTESENRERTLEAAFWGVGSQESFDVEAAVVPRDDGDQVAARHIFDAFDRYVEQARRGVFCADYAQSQQWDNALENCDIALELNPEAVSVRYQRARIYLETERLDEALAELERVVGLDPAHQDALETAGYVSALQGDREQARAYYSRYLELNPGDVAVRIRIARELAQAGDPRGAMELIQVGLDVDPDHVDLLEQFAAFGVMAARQEVEAAEAAGWDGEDVPPAAAALYREAVGAYERVFEIRGAETAVGHLRNIVAAYVQLGELGEAIRMGGRAVETHPGEASLWSLYANALNRAGRLDDAVAALERVLELDAENANAVGRMATWLIEAGEIERAVEVVSVHAADRPGHAETAVGLLFADGYRKGIQVDDYAHALSVFTAARRLPGLTSMWESQLAFWHGYSLFQQAIEDQGPQTVETAEATLPRFRQALELFQQAEEYAASQSSITLAQFLENARTYIEIQEAIIQRGG